MGKPPPLAVRLENALPFRRWVGGENVLWGTPASQATPKPQAQRVERRTVSTRCHGETREAREWFPHAAQPQEECTLMPPFRGYPSSVPPFRGVSSNHPLCGRVSKSAFVR